MDLLRPTVVFSLGIFGPDELQSRTNEGRGKEKKKELGEQRRRRKKSNSCTLSFHNGYFGNSFWPKKKKKLSHAKGPFGGDVFKIRLAICMGS